MKPIQFSLSSLMVSRELEERSALEGYARALQVREQGISAYRASEEEFISVWARLSEKLSASCGEVELTHLKSHFQAVAGRMRECEAAANAARERTEHAFMELLAARQARAVLEKYLARQKRAYPGAAVLLEVEMPANKRGGSPRRSSLAGDKRTVLWN